MGLKHQPMTDWRMRPCFTLKFCGAAAAGTWACDAADPTAIRPAALAEVCRSWRRERVMACLQSETNANSEIPRNSPMDVMDCRIDRFTVSASSSRTFGLIMTGKHQIQSILKFTSTG